MRLDGGSVFPACANAGDPTGPVEAYRLMSRGRGATLQSKVGYVDARPLNRQLDEVLLQHVLAPEHGENATLASVFY
jgi:hypothetical protein